MENAISSIIKIGYKEMSNIIFNLTAHIHAASYNNTIIILNQMTNKYISLGKVASFYLEVIIHNSFKQINSLYLVCHDNHLMTGKIKELNKYIVYFLKSEIIECGYTHIKNSIATADVNNGLKQVEWMPTLDYSSIHATLFERLYGIYILAKIHRTIEISGINGLILLLKEINMDSKIKNRSFEIKNIIKLSYITDQSTLLFYKKTWCLAWAGALAYNLIKHGFSFKLVIGVQTMPFYAHAWIEVNDTVINDDPELKIRLAPILQLNFNN